MVSEGGTVGQVTHNYPFGGVFADAGMGSAVQRYKYNGKELDRMHGLDWYDYGARMYDKVETCGMWVSDAQLVGIHLLGAVDFFASEAK